MWDVGEAHDMCEKWPDEARRGVAHLEYHDEQRWKRLVPKLVELGEKAGSTRSGGHRKGVVPANGESNRRHMAQSQTC